jgi:hypothetical protein
MTNAEKTADLQKRIADAFHGHSNENLRDLVAQLNALDPNLAKMASK